MGFPHRRRLVTLLDVGLMPSGGGPIEPPIGSMEGLGVWYRADQGVMTRVAAQFVATNFEYLSIPSNPSLTLGNISWACGGWVWVDSHSAGAGIMLSKRSAAGNSVEYQTFFYGSGLYTSYWDGTTITNVYTVGPVATNSWHFVMIQRDATAGTLNLYLDNVLVASAALPPPTATGYPLQLGNFDGGTAADGCLTGRMQNWSIFGRLLDATDRSFLWNAGAGRRFEELTPTFKTGLRAWWPLDELSGSRRDLSGNSNTLTDNNTVGFVQGHVYNTPAGDNYGVWRWEDSGPNGFDLQLPGIPNMPLVQTNERNGKSVVRFDGVDDYLQTDMIQGSFLSGPTAQTVFVVQMQSPTDGQSTTYNWDATGAGSNMLGAHLKYSDGVLYYDTGSAVGTGRLRANSPEPWQGTWHVIEMVRDGTTNSSFTIEGNPISVYLNQPVTPFDPAPSAVLKMAEHAIAASGNIFQGDIAEFIMFNRTLTVAERDTIRNYLKTKWGIAQNKLCVNGVQTGYVLLNTTTNDRLAIN